MTLDDLKKIPLAEFCIKQLNYRPNKGHDSKLWRSLKSPRGDVIITRSVPNENGHFLFKGESLGISGSLVDLLLGVENFSLNEILDLYCRDDIVVQKNIQHHPTPKEEDRDNTPLVKREILRYPFVSSDNYLTKRGISLETISFFGIGAGKENFILPLYRLSKKGWVAQTSIRYVFFRETRMRFFQKGLEKKGAFSILKNKRNKVSSFKRVYFFESPIDALSYFELTGDKNGVYISTCGTLTNDFRFTIPLVLEEMGVKEIFLCFDRDDAGKKMTLDLFELLILKLGVSPSVVFPKGKDFNQDLTNKLNQQ